MGRVVKMTIPAASGGAPSVTDLFGAGYGGDALVPLPVGKKGPNRKGWLHGTYALGDFNQADIGLRTARFPTLDVDCDDADMSECVRAALNAWARFNRKEWITRDRAGSPRWAAIFRLPDSATPFQKEVIDFRFTRKDGTGGRFKLELLASGQQVKIVGTHPSGGQYNIQDLQPAHNLIELGGAGARGLLDYMRAELPGLARDAGFDLECTTGGVNPGKVTTGGGSAPVAEWWGSLDKSALADLMRAALHQINPEPLSDDEWLNVMMGLHSTGHPEAWEIADEWCQRDGSRYDAQKNRQRWDSFGGRQGCNLGNSVLHVARQSGWGGEAAFRYKAAPLIAAARTGGAAKVIGASPLSIMGEWADPQAMPDLNAYLSLDEMLDHGIVQIKQDRTILDRKTLAEQGGKGWQHFAEVNIARWQNDPALRQVKLGRNGQPLLDANGQPVTTRASLASYAMHRASVPTVDGQAYVTGAGEFIRDEDGGGSLLLNRWRPSVPMLNARRAGARTLLEAKRAGWAALEDTPWGELVLQMFETEGEPDWRERAGRFMDWAALVVMAPAVKPGHHWYISGPQGTGKSMCAELLGAVLGSRSAQTVGDDLILSGFGDWLEARLLRIDEVQEAGHGTAGGGRKLSAKLKEWTSTAGTWLTINPKGAKPRKVANTSAWLLLSNFGVEQLCLDDDDRRFEVCDMLNRNPALVRKTQQAGKRLGVIKGSGWEVPDAAGKSIDVLTAMAELFLARLADTWGDNVRRKQVTGDAQGSASKRAGLAAGGNLGVLAQAISELWQNGALGDSEAGWLPDLMAMLKRRKGELPPWVQNDVSDQRKVANALREIGAAVRTGDNKLRRIAGPNARLKQAAYILPSARWDFPEDGDKCARDDWRFDMESRAPDWWRSVLDGAGTPPGCASAPMAPVGDDFFT